MAIDVQSNQTDEAMIFEILEDATCSFMSRFVEVKGPRDRLADRQVSWLNILSETAEFKCAAEFEAQYCSAVCYVMESKEKVSKAE